MVIAPEPVKIERWKVYQMKANKILYRLINKPVFLMSLMISERSELQFDRLIMF